MSNARPPVETAVSVRDVAALARVSSTTVSNVLSGNRRVSEATQERVRWAIEQLGYRPNMSARNLRLSRTGLIAIAVPEIDVPYFAELVRHVVQCSREFGYTVLVDQTEGRGEAEHFVIGGMNRGMVDGFLFSPLGINRSVFDQRTDTTPLVLLGERILGTGIDHVGIDNVAAAADATTHLIDGGRRTIAAIGHQKPPGGGTATQRTKGYRQALRSAGLPYDPTLIMQTDNYHRSDGARAMADLLDRGEPLDAVFCYTDLLAIGALHTLHDRGLRVPEDVAVIGMDAIDDGNYSSPTLSTVSPNKSMIAREAVQLLFERIGDRLGRPRQIVVPHQIEVRKSSAARG